MFGSYFQVESIAQKLERFGDSMLVFGNVNRIGPTAQKYVVALGDIQCGLLYY